MDQRRRFLYTLTRQGGRKVARRSVLFHTNVCCVCSARLCGSARRLVFFFVFCGVGFSLLLLWGFVVCWGCLGVAFGWLGSAGPRGTSATLMRRFDLGEGVGAVGLRVHLSGKRKMPRRWACLRSPDSLYSARHSGQKGGSPVPFRAFGTTKLACFVFSLSGQGLRPAHWRITLRMMPSS